MYASGDYLFIIVDNTISVYKSNDLSYIKDLEAANTFSCYFKHSVPFCKQPSKSNKNFCRYAGQYQRQLAKYQRPNI